MTVCCSHSSHGSLGAIEDISVGTKQCTPSRLTERKGWNQELLPLLKSSVDAIQSRGDLASHAHHNSQCSVCNNPKIKTWKEDTCPLLWISPFQGITFQIVFFLKKTAFEELYICKIPSILPTAYYSPKTQEQQLLKTSHVTFATAKICQLHCSYQALQVTR